MVVVTVHLQQQMWVVCWSLQRQGGMLASTHGCLKAPTPFATDLHSNPPSVFLMPHGIPDLSLEDVCFP